MVVQEDNIKRKHYIRFRIINKHRCYDIESFIVVLISLCYLSRYFYHLLRRNENNVVRRVLNVKDNMGYVNENILIVQ